MSRPRYNDSIYAEDVLSQPCFLYPEVRHIFDETVEGICLTFRSGGPGAVFTHPVTGKFQVFCDPSQGGRFELVSTENCGMAIAMKVELELLADIRSYIDASRLKASLESVLPNPTPTAVPRKRERL